MVKARTSLGGLALLSWLSACFSPGAPVTGGTQTDDGTQGTSTSGDSGTTSVADGSDSGLQDESGSATTQGEGDETASAGAAPVIESFTLDGSSSAPTLSVSGGFDLRVVASDDVGVVSAHFLRDGVSLGQGISDGEGTYFVELIVSGEQDNGDSSLEVVVADVDGNETSAELIADVQVPNGGVVEGWDFDGGGESSSYSISPSPNGDQVVWTGNFWNGDQSLARIDRVEGAPWQDVTENDSEFVIDARHVGGDSVVAAISFGDDFPRSTALRRYSGDGVVVATEVLDGGPDGSVDNYPLGLEVDSEGSLYVMGSYAGSALSSYLMKVDPDFDLLWQRDLTGSAATDGAPFVYDFDVGPDGTVAVVGSRVVGTPKLWLATYSSEGELQDQLTWTDEFVRSEGYDVAWTGDGELVISGAVGGSNSDPDDWQWILRRYDARLSPLWTETGPNNTGFGQAVTVDDFGNIISLVLETCSYEAALFAYTNCRLIARKRSPGGTLIWQYQAASGQAEFAGPALVFPGFKADVEVDRFGYSYMTALHRPPVGGTPTARWWATKHNP